MPGFIVGETKAGAAKINLSATTSEYYTNFFWDVDTILNERLSNQAGKAPLLALRDCKLPVFNVEEEKVMGSSIDYKFAKKVSWEPVSMSWYDNVGLLPFMRSWLQSIYTFDGGIAVASDYKKLTRIIAYTQDAKKSQKHSLYQSWPTSIKFSDLSYTTSDIKSVEVTISYDYATMEE